MHTHSFIGNLTKYCSPINKTRNGTDVVNFSVAVNDKKTKTTAYIECTVWGAMCKLEQYLKKGTKVFVHGDFGTNEYNGNTKITCNVAKLELLGGTRRTSEEHSGTTDDSTYTGGIDQEDEIPF